MTPLHTLDEWVRAGNVSLAFGAARGSSSSDEASLDMQLQQEQQALMPPGAADACPAVVALPLPPTCCTDELLWAALCH